MIFEDINSALKLASDSVATLHQNLSAFFNTIPDPFFILDLEGNYIETLGGNSRDLYNEGQYLIGKNFKDVFSPELANQFFSAITASIASRDLVIIEYEIAPQVLLLEVDITPGWFEGRIVPVIDNNGNICKVIWLSINITQKKMLQLELEKQAKTDALTGAYNRRFLYDEIKKEFSRFQRYKTPFSFVSMDIDQFKMINDNHGHDIGDSILKHISTVTSNSIRKNDVFARFGGEEFVVLLPNTRLNDGRLVAEKIRNKIHSNPLLQGNTEIPYTASIGVSQVIKEDECYEAIIKRADKALYQSKQAGRNRVNIA